MSLSIKNWAKFGGSSPDWSLDLILLGLAIGFGAAITSRPVQELTTVATGAVSGQAPTTNVSVSLDPKWKAKKSADFLNKAVAIAKDLGANPNHLMAIMQFESDISHTNQNRLSGATGLIQFMPNTAANLGTSISALLSMSEIEQLDYVRKYLMPYKGKLNTVGDFYAAVFWPAAVGKPDDYVIASGGSLVYRQNNGFDKSRKGYFTKGDIAAMVMERL